MGHLPDGAHTHGDSGSGLGIPLAAGAGAVLLSAILPALVAILDAALIAAAVIIGVAILAGTALVIWRLRRTPATPPWQPGTLQPPPRPAIAPREIHLHLHGASPADIAEALAQLPQSTGSSGPASNYRPASRQEQP